MRRIQPLLPPLAFLALYTAWHLAAARSQPIVTMVDYWTHLQWARELSLQRPETWVHPFYPLGYFALLRIGLATGLDVVFYGQILSWLGAIAGLTSVYMILHRATGRAIVGLAGMALLTLHPFFRFQALQEGTDMLASGLQLLAVAAAFGGSIRGKLWPPAVAGALLGGAYLIRYTSLTLLPVLVIYFLWRDWGLRRGRWRSAAVVVGAFSLIALPQLAAGAFVAGNPLYNEQARNVWFGLYGDFNWTDNWGDIPQGVSLGKIVRDDPSAFLGHWAREFGRVLRYDSGIYVDDPLGLERKVTLWEPVIIHLLWLASAGLLILDRRLTRPQIGLLLLALLIPILATSMAWLFTRYLLVMLALQVILLVLAAGHVAGRVIAGERSTVAVSLITLSGITILFLLSTGWNGKAERTREIVSRVIAAQPLLAAVGVDSPQALMTNNRLYQVVNDAERAQYSLFQSPGEAAQSLDTAAYLAAITGGPDPTFLLFDWTSHAIRTIPVLERRAELAAAEELLAPLSATDEYTLYCVLPCRADEAVPVGAAAGPELVLDGYRAIPGQDEQHGLYLYWRLLAPVKNPTSLDFTLRDPTGEIIYHSSSSAQNSNYLLDRRPAGETIVDFHLIGPARIDPEAVYELTVGPDDGSGNGLTIPIRFGGDAEE